MNGKILNSGIKRPHKAEFAEIVAGDDSEGLVIDAAFGGPQSP